MTSVPDRAPVSPTASASAPAPRPTRSRAPPTRAAAGPACGTRSARGPARSRTAAAARWPATTTTATPRTSALMRDLGIGGYRLSVAWPRDPARGQRPRERRRASRSTTGWSTRLLEAGVRPMVTLFHWDLPQAARGRAAAGCSATPSSGSRSTPPWSRMRLGDRVEHWCPVNEPNIVTMLGHALGVHAPGRQLMFDALPVAHHLYSRTAAPSRRCGATGARSVGTANNHAPVWAATDAPADVAAADVVRRAVEPDLRRPDAARPLPRRLRRADARTGRGGPRRDQRTDRLLRPELLQPGPGRRPRVPDPGRARRRAEDAPFKLVEVEGYPRTAFDWPVVPDGLRELLVGLKDGVRRRSCRRSTSPRTAVRTTTTVGVDGEVHDPDRVAYLDAHLRAVAQAVERGRRRRAATTPGRCSTTSSGPRGTPSASAWCTSTTTPSGAPPRTPIAWYRDVIAAQPPDEPTVTSPLTPPPLAGRCRPSPSRWSRSPALGHRGHAGRARAVGRLLRADPGAARPAGAGGLAGPQGVRLRRGDRRRVGGLGGREPAVRRAVGPDHLALRPAAAVGGRRRAVRRAGAAGAARDRRSRCWRWCWPGASRRRR